MNKEGKIILTIVTLIYILITMVAINKVEVIYTVVGSGLVLTFFIVLLLIMFVIYLSIVFSILKKYNKKIF